MNKLTSMTITSAVVVGLAVACSVDVDVANKACPCGEGYVCDDVRKICVRPELLTKIQEPPPPCDPCSCTTDAECKEKDPARPKCGPDKLCVECTKSPDSCTAGYCNDKFQCASGCKDEADCQKISPGTHCDLARHQCVQCIATTFPCTDATKSCSPSGVCVEGCSATKPCTGGKECCNGLCLDTKADVLNCGACGKECVKTNGTPSCSAGVCKWACVAGYTHCAAPDANTGCEVNTARDATRCGSCTTNCASVFQHANATCNNSQCTFAGCQPFFASFDGSTANGCEAPCGDKNESCCPSGAACKPGNNCNGGSGKCN